MTFLHEHSDFGTILTRASQARRLPVELIEKDYWVTHVLWALQDAGWEVWFKGGPCLAKGYGLIQRFSEDLDLKLEAGSVAGVPRVSDWTRESSKAVAARRHFFECLVAKVAVPGANVVLDTDRLDAAWRSADLLARYTPLAGADSSGLVPPAVRLEIGSGRVLPCLPRDIGSWAHEAASALRPEPEGARRTPRGVRCVHPVVTLVEKIDALQRRYPRADLLPSAFVRHYEDAASVVRHLSELPALPQPGGAAGLAQEMLGLREIRALPDPDHAAFLLPDGERSRGVRAAFGALGPLYWGNRTSLDECVAILREWIRLTFA